MCGVGEVIALLAKYCPTVVDYGGAVGACGTPIQDTDLAVALPSSQFATSLCGQQITITRASLEQFLNATNTKSVVGTTTAVSAVVADTCSGCHDQESLDIGLTEAAFEALAPLSEGTPSIDVIYGVKYD
ncbi:hypothetical protein C8F01DRAFT_1090976 [Mycena amicta]|nr:hypothetical protein C8F01DRAFT_1090976 [Mycena amicta]